MRLQGRGLWQNPDFLKLWGAYSTSGLGSNLASLAYSLTAVITLHASAMEVGLLGAAGPAASGLVGLLAGVIVDRVSRKPLLIVSDLVRAVLALTIPAAYILGVLRIEQLYVVAFLTGIFSIVADVGIMAYIPALAKKDELIEANSKFAMTDSANLIAGTSVSGVLVQALTAPIAIIVDACSFVLSALLLLTIRRPEPHAAAAREDRQSIRKDIAEGLRFVYGNRILRPLAEELALYFYFIFIFIPIFNLYAVRELGFEPVLLGVVISMIGVGFLVSALAVKRITARFGIGRTMIGGGMITAIALFLMPLQGNTRAVTVAILIAAHFLLALGIQAGAINLMSLRQAITPGRLQGRMNASFRFVNVCMTMLGSLTAGVLGETIGLRATLLVAACGMLLPFLRLFFSPVRQLQHIPDDRGKN
jgi:MFS family permease